MLYRHYGQYGGHAKALLQGFALERRLLNCINWLVITMKIAYAMKRKKSLLRYFCYLSVQLESVSIFSMAYSHACKTKEEKDTS